MAKPMRLACNLYAQINATWLVVQAHLLEALNGFTPLLGQDLQKKRFHILANSYFEEMTWNKHRAN